MHTEELQEAMDQTLSELGLPLTTSDLRRDNAPTANVLEQVVREVGRHRLKLTQHASSIGREMSAVTNDGRWPSSLINSSDLQNYESSIAAIDALRETLSAAAVAYRQTH